MMHKRFAGVLAAVLSLAIMAGCSGSQKAPSQGSGSSTSAPAAPSAPAPTTTPPAAAPKKGGSFVHGMAQEPDMLDLHKGTSRYDRQVTVMIYDSLLFNDNGTIKPWLATAHTKSADGLTYTFKLRSGVKFHDGTDFNAQAVKANWERIMDPATKSPQALSLLGPVAKIDTPDATTVSVTFKQPHPDFIINLASPNLAIQGPDAMKKFGADYGRNPVGTGPYKFVSWTAKDSIVLERFAGYAWPPEGVTQNKGEGYLDKITYKFMNEDATRVASLEKGDIQAAMRLPPQTVATYQNNPNYYVLNAILPGTGVILLVNAAKPPTDDIAVRKAIMHLTNPQEIARIGYFNTHKPHLGSVLSEPNPYFKDTSKMYPFDVAKANQLLEDAGWKKGADGIREKNGVKASLIYIGFPTPETTRTVEYMNGVFKQAGMQIAIKTLEGPAISAARRAGEHNIAHLTYIFMEPSFLRGILHTDQIGVGFNFMFWRDKKWDELLEAGMKETDEAKRKALYEEAQTRAIENAVVVPTVYQHQIMAISKKVKGAKLYPIFGEYLWLYDASFE